MLVNCAPASVYAINYVRPVTVSSSNRRNISLSRNRRLLIASLINVHGSNGCASVHCLALFHKPPC